jgi:hypothetical protein
LNKFLRDPPLSLSFFDFFDFEVKYSSSGLVLPYRVKQAAKRQAKQCTALFVLPTV